MPHVSIDGPVQPLYVNVTFQQAEIEIRGMLVLVGLHLQVNNSLFLSLFDVK